jgi:hypothetical protein
MPPIVAFATTACQAPVIKLAAEFFHVRIRAFRILRMATQVSAHAPFAIALIAHLGGVDRRLMLTIAADFSALRLFAGLLGGHGELPEHGHQDGGEDRAGEKALCKNFKGGAIGFSLQALELAFFVVVVHD